MKSYLLSLTALVLALAFTSCNVSESQLKETLKKNPSILTEAIKENPSEFIEALNEAVKVAREDMQKKKEVEEKKQLEEYFDEPLQAKIRTDELIRGTKDAPITLVEYSDFECPYCTRGYKTVMELLEKYEGKIQFVYKHLPLSFHPNAMPASQYYEAIRLQNEDKAVKFHDELFENQSKIKQGEKYFKSLAKKLGVDMKKLAKDVNSQKVKDRIEGDLKEAAKFGFQGTPGFLLNGIPVKGAYPTSHFVDLIKKLEEKGKVKL
ncbi:MAG: thioredoxin domain-containing protein [Bacteriovoracaceae bacterium]